MIPIDGFTVLHFKVTNTRSQIQQEPGAEVVDDAFSSSFALNARVAPFLFAADVFSSCSLSNSAHNSKPFHE